MIADSFTPLEMQLLRASLGTRTTDDIAALLERSSSEVIGIINYLTDGKAEERERDVRLWIAEQEAQKAKKKTKPKTILVKRTEKRESEAELSRKNKRLEAERKWEAQRNNHRKREDQRKYKTRAQDPTKLITVKLDEKTWAQVEIQETTAKTQELITKVKAAYDANKTLNQFKHGLT